jgi:hypothetical protein
MSARLEREVTREEALTDLTSFNGNRSIETAGGFSFRLQRATMPMDERRALSSLARTIVDGRELCINECGRLQETASIQLCQTCNKEKNKRKKEEDEKLGARICAECDEEIVGRMLKGCCNPCYRRQYRETGRVVDPETKLCTHVSVCSNKRYLGGLCRRHYTNRHLDASSTSEYAAAARAATAPKKKRRRKLTKTKKPVVINKDGKTVGLRSFDYEDEEVEVEVDSDDDDDDWTDEN